MSVPYIHHGTGGIPWRPIPGLKAELVQLVADRALRSMSAMEPWATKAKECVELVEGELEAHWGGAEAIKKAIAEKRPLLRFNKTNSLVRLVLGYHRNNRVDAKFLPDDEGLATDQVAETLSQLDKHACDRNDVEYVDTEVFLDGILTGRGYYDQRLSFERNDLGEVKITCPDPFSIGLDPDAVDYDVAQHGHLLQFRTVSIDEIEFTYGPQAAYLVAPLISSRAGVAGMPAGNLMYDWNEIAPWRTFGGAYETDRSPHASIAYFLANALDPYRKSIKLVDMQHKVRVWQRVFYDLETGDKEPIPGDWQDEQVAKVLQYFEQKYAQRGELSPMTVRWMPMQRVRWTTMVGDIIVFDDWSPYESFTISAFFPYFRRGKTRGMVEDLIDPQREINKRRSANIDQVTRTTHSGWKYHENSLEPREQERLERMGGAPGYNMKWRGDQEPKKIESSAPPTAFERLEMQSAADMKEISGVNDSLLGLIEQAHSGRAIEARQRQGVLSIQTYMDNGMRTKKVTARKRLELYQNHYTEKRIVRVRGEQGKLLSVIINMLDPAEQRIINDVTLGKYAVSVEQSPLTASFLAAQFEELIQMVEVGLVPREAVMDLAVDVSSLPHKEVIKQRVAMVMAAMGIPTGDMAGMGTQMLGPNGQPMPVGQAGPLNQQAQLSGPRQPTRGQQRAAQRPRAGGVPA